MLRIKLLKFNKSGNSCFIDPISIFTVALMDAVDSRKPCGVCLCLCEIGTAGSLWQQDTLNQQAQILGLLFPIPRLLLCCLPKL